MKIRILFSAFFFFLSAASKASNPYSENLPTYSSVFVFESGSDLEEANTSLARYHPERRVFYGQSDGAPRLSPPGLFRYESSERFSYAHVSEDGAESVQERTSLFGELQFGALQRMYLNGYISAQEFKQLEDVAQYRNNPLIVSRIYSELTLAEAEAIFGKGKIPWERVFSGSETFKESQKNQTELRDQFHFSMLQDFFVKSGEKLKILRSSVIVFLGQNWDPDQEKFLPLPLPAEKSQGLLASLDREKFPLIAQVGRAISEGEPLKGVFHHAIQAVLPYLKFQAQQAGIPEDRYLVMNTVDDDAHVRVYAHSLNLRILDQSLHDELNSQEPQRASEIIRQVPLPTGLKAGAKNKYLMVGTLALGLEKLADSAFSWLDWKVKSGLAPAASGLSLPEQIHRRFQEHVIQLLDLRFPGDQSIQKPVFVMNLDHPMLASLAYRDLRSMGDWGEQNLQELVQHLLSASLPSGFIGPQNPKLLIPVDLVKKHAPSIVVQQFDPQLLEKYGELYLASVVLAVEKQWQENAASLPVEAPNYSFKIAEGWLDFRPQLSMQEENSAEAKSFIVKPLSRAEAERQKPKIFFLSDQPALSRVFKNLGADPSAAVRAEVLAQELKTELEASMQTALREAMANLQGGASGIESMSPAEAQQRLNAMLAESLQGFSQTAMGGLSDMLTKRLQVSDATAFQFSEAALESLKIRYPYLWTEPPLSRNGHQSCESALWAAFP